MALVNKIHLTGFALLIGSVSFAGLIYESYQVHHIQRFNDALARAAFDEAGVNDSVHGRLAKAYAYQQVGEFEQALKEYAAIERDERPQVRSAVKYNMANLYLQKASKAWVQGEQDVAIPLIELAKYHYRGLLRINHGDWYAKYNLERALQLLPELEDEEFPDDIMPERSPEAAGAIETYRELP